jgi:subtilase family serine protease
MSKFIRICNRKIFILFIAFILFFSVLNISTIVRADSKPDLIIDSLNCPENITEGDNVKIIVKIKNIGTKNISVDTIIGLGLYIDGVLVTTNSTSKGLAVGASRFVNFSWIATLDVQTQRLLRAFVDYQGTILESNEDNNIWDKFINVYEGPTELKIINLLVPAVLRVNETVDIYANITNNGKDTHNTISAKLSTDKEGVIQTKTKENGLDKGKTYNFSFKWTPRYFGNQNINVTITHGGKIHDYRQITKFVDVAQLKWWNASWHYRHFVVVKGRGNVSLSLNFTKFLNNLNVFSQKFENDTIRIIEYLTNGSIVRQINLYKFNESLGFNSINNATGALLWNVSGSSTEKYYCIYFDVGINPGNRKVLNETTMIKSGSANLNYSGFVGGWWAEIVQPINGSYCLVNTSINITALTTARAENVTAHIWTLNENHNLTLVNTGNNISWSNNFYFDKEGLWKIGITSGDKAGYESAADENSFYVGKPDLKITDINITTNWPPTSPKVYKNDNVTITAIVRSYNATVSNVNISIYIYDTSNNLYYSSNITGVTVIKDKENKFSFSPKWYASKMGKYKTVVTVDPANKIDESNESNNQITKNITVYGWPDLAVLSVILPSDPIAEMNTVKIDAVIANKGYANASDYEVRLYIEPNQTGNMKYDEAYKRYSTLVSVTMNTSKQISLVWNSTQPGDWMVGIKIITTDTKRDTNMLNNQLPSNKTLKVASIERNPPVISKITVLPKPQEQNGFVTISADITDDSGLSSVIIKITNPKGDTVYNGSMARISGNTSFSLIFRDTLTVGVYRFNITAVDTSIYANKAKASGNFTITKDSTPPSISYFDARPHAQLQDEYVTIECIATDNIGIESVKINITHPDGSKDEKSMTFLSDGKYLYSKAYDGLGKYRFNIIVRDKAGNEVLTDYKTFWITQDVNDSDNDGMPDSWEEKYGLNPDDPTDANGNIDGDEYTNLKEYKIGTNPAKDIFLENAGYRVKENGGFLVASLVLFIVIVLMSIYGERRRLK